jgi:hypothetical protein
VRVRTLLSFASGAALGAGWMYLADPDHGPDRRREARRTALRRARHGVVAVAAEARRRAEEVALAAAAGYQQGRVEQESEVTAPLPVVEDRALRRRAG